MQNDDGKEQWEKFLLELIDQVAKHVSEQYGVDWSSLTDDERKSWIDESYPIIQQYLVDKFLIT